jgi:hypothetical protein
MIKAVHQQKSKMAGRSHEEHHLLQDALHFLKAKHDALDEDHHAPWEEESPSTYIAVSLCVIISFCAFNVESLAVLTQAPCSAACTDSTLMS